MIGFLSDIPRWSPYWYGMGEDDEGNYVKHADHVAALLTQDRQHMEQQAAAVQVARAESYADGRVDGMRDVADLCYQRGVQAARDAVAALPAYYAIEECQGNPLEKGDPEDPDPWKQGHLIERDDALAAIDALTTRGKEGR